MLRILIVQVINFVLLKRMWKI